MLTHCSLSHVAKQVKYHSLAQNIQRLGTQSLSDLLVVSPTVPLHRGLRVPSDWFITPVFPPEAVHQYLLFIHSMSSVGMGLLHGTKATNGAIAGSQPRSESIVSMLSVSGLAGQGSEDPDAGCKMMVHTV